ncbi:MAG TPA: ABC transporter ATP-binding protein [Enterovirga sp.]|jgi:branched-chain amino acid transport system ATP-binding protein
MNREMTTDLLSVQGLSASYGGVEALHGVTLHLGAGEIATVIGPNGAGKTTLLAAIMGVIPSRGQVTFAGEQLGLVPVEERLRRGLCLVPEKRELFATMSVSENLELGAYARRREGRAARQASLEEVYDLFPRLKERSRQLAGTLSGGERQMLAMGRALMARPRLLMLDEPSLGLAPLIVAEIFRIVAELRRRGTAILLVEQNARAALEVADRGLVLELGSVLLEGPSRVLAEDPRVLGAYLGGSVAA